MPYMRDSAGQRLDTFEVAGKSARLGSGLLNPATFDPLREIPNLLAWLDPAILTGANGSNVSALPGRFGGVHLYKGSATKPTLVTNAQNGRQAVRFTSATYLVDDLWASANVLNSPSGGWPQPLTYAFVVRASSNFGVAGNSFVIGNGGVNVNIAGSGQTIYPSATSTALGGGPPINDGAWHIYVVVIGAAGATIYCDGYLVAGSLSQSQGVGSATGFQLGITGTFTGTIDFGDVLLYQTVPSGAQVDRLTQAIATVWGLS